MPISKCTCTNPGQDKLHGKKLRVHTVLKDNKLRCTVCGNVKQ